MREMQPIEDIRNEIPVAFETLNTQFARFIQYELDESDDRFYYLLNTSEEEIDFLRLMKFVDLKLVERTWQNEFVLFIEINEEKYSLKGNMLGDIYLSHGEKEYEITGISRNDEPLKRPTTANLFEILFTKFSLKEKLKRITLLQVMLALRKYENK